MNMSETASNLGRTAGETLDKARQETAAALENAATSVRSTGHHGAETMETMTESAAAKLDSTAAYVRSHDVGAALTSIRQVISRHPTTFLVLAAGIGFLAGSAFERTKSTE